jgi:UTP:GlnB (protein PII) uridylyltransferase
MESGNVPELLQQRRARTDERVAQLRSWLTAAQAEAFTGDSACVYATGSVGRGEASEHSDLDVLLCPPASSNNSTPFVSWPS